VERHFGGYLWQRLHQEVSGPHSGLHCAEGMLDCFTSLTHFLRMLIKAPLHSFENVLVFPSRDQPLLAGDALMPDGATLACVGPIAAQNQAFVLCREVIGELLASRTDINI